MSAETDESTECLTVQRGRLSAQQCNMLRQSSQDYVYKQFEALRDPRRLFLMELACSPDSVLSKEVEKQGYRATRCSHLNGYDLATCEGVRNCLKLLQKERPEHLWISTECTAYSPMQNLNQRNEEQKARLQQKKQEHRVQHSGALMVAGFAYAIGTSQLTSSGLHVVPTRPS